MSGSSPVCSFPTSLPLFLPAPHATQELLASPSFCHWPGYLSFQVFWCLDTLKSATAPSGREREKKATLSLFTYSPLYLPVTFTFPQSGAPGGGTGAGHELPFPMPLCEALSLSALSNHASLTAGVLGLVVGVSHLFFLALILFPVPPCLSLEHSFPVF